MIFSLAQDFHDAVAAMPREHPKRRILELLEEAIRRDIHFIARHPTTLFQSLWNTCWWYDCPEVVSHSGEVPSGRTGSNERPEKSCVEAGLCELMDRWRTEGAACSGRMWFRSLTPPNVRLTGRSLLTLGGHQDMIQELCYSGDGRRLATCAMDGTVRLWDPRTGAQVFLIQASCSRVNRLAFSPDGRHVAYGVFDDKLAAVCDLETGTQVHHSHRGWVNAVAFSPDGRTVASGATDEDSPHSGEIHVWDARTGATRWERSFPIEESCVADIAFNPRDGLLVYAVIPYWSLGDVRFYACDLRTRSLQNSRLLERYEGSQDSTRFMSLSKVWAVFSPDGRYLATRWCPCHRDPQNPNAYHEDGHAVRVWRWSGGSIELLVDIPFDSTFECFAFSTDGGRLLVAAGDDSAIWSCDIGTGRRKEFRSPDGEPVLAMAVSPVSPGTVATGTGSQKYACHIWCPEERSKEDPFVRPVAGHLRKISPSGNWILTSQREHLHLWDTKTARLGCSVALTTDAIFMMMSVGIDQRDRLLAVALACEMDYAPYMRHRVEIIESDGNTYRTRTVLDVPCEEPTKHLITDLAFSIDCRHLFLEVNSGFLTRVWDLDEEQELGPPVPQEILGKRAPFNHPEQVAIASKKDGGTPVRVPLVSSKGRESSRSAESWPMRMLQKGLDFSLLSENQQVVATIPNDMTFGICWPRRRLWINTDDGYLSMLELELGGSP